MYRINDWDTTLTIERKWNHVHLYLGDRDGQVHMELTPEKVEQLIKILEQCK